MSHAHPLCAALAVSFFAACGSAPSGEPAGRASQAQTAAASSPATITFAASWTDSASSLVAGQTAQLSYDASRLTQCRGSTGYGGEPGWSIEAYYTVNGIVMNAPVGVAGLALANEHLAPGALPSFTLPFAGTMQMWFENTDVFGCTAWDSDYGANYSLLIAPPTNAPGWVSDASYLLDRGTCGNGPCWQDGKSADGGLTFDTWARVEAVITELYFDVWKSGVTDFDNPSLWQELDVEAHTRFDPTQPFTTTYVNFDERMGNNARYVFPLRPLDPLGGINGAALTSASQCPAIPVSLTADGQYVQANMDVYFTVNGVAVQPASGGPFHVAFQNYAGLYAVCAYAKGS